MPLEIQSKEVIDKISEDLKIQPAALLPRKVSNQIDLSYNVNPVRIAVFGRGLASDATTANVLTAHATKRTFITAVTLSVSKDSSSDSNRSAVNAQPVGKVSNAIIELRYEPSTAGEHHLSLTLKEPLELEKGSAVAIANSTNTASIDTAAVVHFFETDPQ